MTSKDQKPIINFIRSKKPDEIDLPKNNKLRPLTFQEKLAAARLRRILFAFQELGDLRLSPHLVDKAKADDAYERARTASMQYHQALSDLAKAGKDTDYALLALAQLDRITRQTKDRKDHFNLRPYIQSPLVISLNDTGPFLEIYGRKIKDNPLK